MGWLRDKLFKKQPANSIYADMLNGFTPIFSTFGTDIYASDVVQQAIWCIVSELKKLNPMHIKTNGQDMTPVKGSIQSVLNAPNATMTTCDFIEKVSWLLILNYNAFIIPDYYVWKDKDGHEKRYYNGLYPICPQQVDFIEDGAGELYVKFWFANNYQTTIKYSDVIHLRHHFSVNEYMGGNAQGQPDNKALLETLGLNDTMLKGVAKAMKASYAVNGVVKYKTVLDKGKTELALAELEEKLRNGESGFFPLDLTGDFTPISRDVQLVDEGTLKFIDEKILRHFGVPLPILTGDFTPAQYGAFYQKTLETFIVVMSQGFTKGIFTQRERAFSNQIRFFPKELVFMSTDQTLEMVRLLGDSGTLYENEKRVAFGLPPVPELAGVRMQSLNYVNVNDAHQYQTGDSGNDEQQNEEELQ